MQPFVACAPVHQLLLASCCAAAAVLAQSNGRGQAREEVPGHWQYHISACASTRVRASGGSHTLIGPLPGTLLSDDTVIHEPGAHLMLTVFETHTYKQHAVCVEIASES